MPIKYRKQLHRYRRYLVGAKGLRKKKAVQAYTIVILSLLTISFFIVSAIRPTLKTIASLMAELREKREIDQKLEEKVNALAEARANYQKIKDDLPLMEQALPPEAEFTLLMIQIEVLAHETNVALTEEEFRDVGLNFTHTNKIQFELQADGRYQDLKSFLARLEDLRRITVLESSLFEKPSKEEERKLLLKLEAEIQSLKK